MTHTHTTTRRNVLRGTAAALASLSLAGSAGAGATTQEESSTPQEAHRSHESNTAREESHEVAATVDEINAQEQSLAVLTEDGTRLCGSPDVYDVREGDRVTATVRDGRVIALSRREQNPTDGGSDGELTDGGSDR